MATAWRTLENLVGECFGRGTVLSFVGSRINGKKPRRFWRLRCNCGNEYEAHTSSLTRGHVRSCGCLAREVHTQTIKLYGTPTATKPQGVAAFNQLLASYKYKSKARKKKRVWRLTDKEFRDLIYGDCHYCGIPPSRMHGPNGKKTSGIVVNGIDRVDNAMGYTTDNCVSCCYHCNTSKRARSKKDFLDWAARVYNHSLAGDVT